MLVASPHYHGFANSSKSFKTSSSIPPNAPRLYIHLRKQARSHLAREHEEGTHQGITTEVLEGVAQEAALRDVGEPERADNVRRKALQAR